MDNNIRISKIEIFQSPIKLKEPFIISLGKLEYAENIIIKIRTDKNITGFGECSPFLTINGENMSTGFIVGELLAKGLVGQNPLDIENCHKIMNKIIYGNASIKSAFDIALYDIAAQNSNLPLYSYLGGSKNKIVITDYTVSIGNPVKMAEDALKIKKNGFQIIKVKLGGSSDEDVERIRLIREAVGYEIPLRIDANQGWNTESAISILKRLEPYKIQHCEEPIPRWAFMDLPKIKEQSPIPIMADESCCDHHDAQRLMDIKACTLLNVKLGKSSGIFDALKILKIAEEYNVNVQIGGFLESRLAFTASAHLAFASDKVIYYDFDTPLMFIEDPVRGGISYDKDGVITVPDSPGLGAYVEQNYLDRLNKMLIE